MYMIIRQNKLLRCFTYVCYKDVWILHLKYILHTNFTYFGQVNELICGDSLEDGTFCHVHRLLVCYVAICLEIIYKK